MRLGLPHRILVVAIALLATLLARLSYAAPMGIAPSIERGREAEVLALFAPILLGGEVTPGWKLEDVDIEARRIRCVMEGPDGAKATVILDHPERLEWQRTSKNFAMRGDPAPGSGMAGEASVVALMDAVQRNDQQNFWRLNLMPPTGGLQSGSSYPRWFRVVPAWLTDGVLLLAALVVLLGLMLWRDTRDAPPWIRLGLVGVLLLSGVLRLWLSPRAALDVWSYSRSLPFTRAAFEGPLLPAISRITGRVFYFTDVTFAMNLVIGIITPLAMFTHARPLLRDHRVALVAAAVLAIAPSHIRFSDSDTAFIPALALSSITFGLVHRAVRDASAFWRVCSLLVLPILMLTMLAVRPLNILFLPLYFVQLFGLDDSRAPTRRRLIVAGLTALVGAGFFLLSFLIEHEQTIISNVDLGLPLRVLTALWTPRLNTLIHPTVTPPGLTLLGAVGAWWLWHRGESRKAVFLVGWLALFFAGHAVVLPSTVEMQSRYQIHLVVPLAMLAAEGLEALASRSQRARVIAAVYVAASPLIHLRFIRDVAFNDIREFAFVESVREQIPEGCSVLEFDGPPASDHDSRFNRIGLSIRDGEVGQRFITLPIGGADERVVIRPEIESMLEVPPSCLYFYEGIPCQSEKEPTQDIAPACAQLKHSLPMTRVASERFPSRPYDEHLSKGFSPSLRMVEITLYKVTTPSDE